MQQQQRRRSVHRQREYGRLRQFARGGCSLLASATYSCIIDITEAFHVPSIIFSHLVKNKKQTISPYPELPSSKRRIFFVIMLGTPFAFVFLLEIGLRLFTQGEDISLFTTEVLAGRVYTVMNPGVKQRYFAHVPFSPGTSPDYFEVPKPRGTTRIFCLGGSTTVGYPYWYNGSFSSFLRDRLRRVFSDRHIEVINVGMTATNSYTVNDMARELVDYEPDLFIVYDGHNEFYGALGVASHESFARSRWLTKAYLRLIHFRTFRLLQNFVASIVGVFQPQPSTAAVSTMMEKLAKGQYIPYGSELYNDGLTVFKENLLELTEIASNVNTPLLLAAQVSNLKSPPFISEDDKSKAGKRRPGEFTQAFNRGLKLWERGDIETAQSTFDEATRIDSLRADAHFYLAKCLDSLGLDRAAYHEYVKARDYDMLRFRMSTDFNTVMKDVAMSHGATFVDMEQVFREHSPDSLIGKELIVEHLHPNTYGSFLMAHAYANAMRQNGFLASPEEWTNRDTISNEELWATRPVTETDERIANRRIEILTSGWPFKPQAPQVDAVPENDTLGQIAERVVLGESHWRQAHNEAAEYYLGRQNWSNAIAEYKALTNQLPLIDVQPYLKLARLYLNAGDAKNARLQLLSSLNLSQTILAYRALGDLAMQDHKPKEAIPFYKKTVAFSTSPQEQIENGYLLALAYTRSDSPDQARAELLQILVLKPDYQPAMALLATIQENH